MNTTPFLYSIGNIVKINKIKYDAFLEGKVGIIVEREKTSITNEYKTLICGYENQEYYFVENEILGKLEEENK